MLGSFKFKLVGTFLALSVLPLAAAFWGFSQVAERSVTTSADDRLAAGLTAALAAFEDERRNAERAAATLGGNKAFQTAVARGDRATIARLLAHVACAPRRDARRRHDRACAAAGRRDDGFARRTRQPLRDDRRLGSPQ